MTAGPLRSRVLGGRFFGPGDADAAAGVAELLVAGSCREGLSAWYGQDGLRRIVSGAADRGEALRRLEEAVDRDVARLDALVSAQVDAILHHPRVRALEGSWRGLAWLVGEVPPGTKVRIRILQIRWAELCRDLERAVELDQSQLFGKIYEEEFGQPGGEPYGLLAIDHEVRHVPAPRGDRPGSQPQTNDVAALGSLAGIAAAAFAPTVIGCSPALFGLDEFAEGGPAFDLTDAVRSADHILFRRLQERSDTRFLGLALPRLLGRAPWARHGARPDTFVYRENAPDAGARVWVSPVYALSAVAVRAFLRFGWPADVRGAEPALEPTGGVVVPPAVEVLPSDPLSHRGAPRAPLDLALTDVQERQLAEAGFIPLAALEAEPEAAFAALPSMHRPPRLQSAGPAEANQRLSAQFNAMLCVSRIAHCVKIMGRDMVGAYRTAEEIELALRRWLGRLSSSMLSGPETAARYPLLDARVEIREHPGEPGVYGCIMHLQPHYQLDEVGAVFRLVTDLQGPRAAA